MSIDWNKPIETVSGILAKIISTDFRNRFNAPVVLQIEYANCSIIGHYTSEGKSEYGSPEIRNRKIKREGWVNIYPDELCTGYYKTEIEARAKAQPTAITQVKIEWEEQP